MADKYVVVKTVVVEQAKKGFSLVASGARKGWAFVKGKVDEARGTPPLPVAEAPEKAQGYSPPPRPPYPHPVLTYEEEGRATSSRPRRPSRPPRPPRLPSPSARPASRGGRRRAPRPT